MSSSSPIIVLSNGKSPNDNSGSTKAAWHQLQRYVAMSFPFYYAEQVLQRDSSNAIHYAHFWTQSRDHAMGLCRELEQQDGLTQAELSNIRLCVRKIEKRDEKVKSCGVFNLCRILWPDPDQVSQAGWNVIIEELKWLVAKQWDKWVELKDVVQLPWEDDDALNNQSDFVRRCVLDLSHHRSGEMHLIQDGRQAFRRAVQSVRREYESAECYAKPKNSKSSIWVSNVQTYWSMLRYSCPAIYFVYHLLSHCCATEAGTERMFSSEKLIHSLIRNQLSPELVRAIMTIRWNYEAIQQFQGNIVQRENGAGDDIVDFVPYEWQ